MPTATTATEGPKPDHGLLDWEFLALMDDGFTCGPDVATYSLAERLLCELGGVERAMGAALVFDRGQLDWEVDALNLSGEAKAVLFVPTERAARDAVRAVGALYGCEFREVAAVAQ